MARLAGPLVLLLEAPEEASSGAAAVLCEDDSATGICDVLARAVARGSKTGERVA